ncbi:MAG: hypothetical protein J5I59_04135 [Saprospiraceae bacterium]|nr:hypothetical protein [Saprospiraceae bacterium]
MKYILAVVMTFLFVTNSVTAQKAEPWTPKQLMSTEDLAKKIENKQTDNLVIISIGPDEVIPGTIFIGPANNKDNLKKLKSKLKGISKDKEVVIYCGCCPFDRCPNVRPAFTALKEMGFKNARLLDIPHNIKVDWLDKDYPSTD